MWTTKGKVFQAEGTAVAVGPEERAWFVLDLGCDLPNLLQGS